MLFAAIRCANLSTISYSSYVTKCWQSYLQRRCEADFEKRVLHPDLSSKYFRLFDSYRVLKKDMT